MGVVCICRHAKHAKEEAKDAVHEEHHGFLGSFKGWLADRKASPQRLPELTSCWVGMFLWAGFLASPLVHVPISSSLLVLGVLYISYASSVVWFVSDTLWLC